MNYIAHEWQVNGRSIAVIRCQLTQIPCGGIEMNRCIQNQLVQTLSDNASFGDFLKSWEGMMRYILH